MSIASKLVLTVALAGFALPVFAQGSTAPAPTDLQSGKPAIHQSAPVSGAAKVSTAPTVASKPVAVKTEVVKPEAAKTEAVKASSTKSVSTTTTAPVIKSN